MLDVYILQQFKDHRGLLMDEQDIIDNDKDIHGSEQKPIEVTIKDKEKPKDPSFDYDDYSPTNEEILDIETEIAEKITKRTKQNG